VLEGQSIGIVPPGNRADGRPHNIRLYSIASARDGEKRNANNVGLTVKRVEGGVASNYVCDLAVGDKVEVTGPFGATFLMPDDTQSNVIMICTGTGSAPFRAFTERRRRTASEAPGKFIMFLFAGHDDGAENWAILASLIETCKLNGIDPQAWLADVLTRLVNLWPNNRLDELLPWTWVAARPQQQRAA
jgi:hypothetical protein